MMNGQRTVLASAAFLALTMVFAGCAPPANGPGNATSTSGQVSDQKPVLDVTPAQRGDGDVKIVEAGATTFTVTAPGAESVKILYRPTIADEAQFVRLKEIAAPTDKATGKFTSEVTLPADFAGEVWAEIAYEGGKTAKTDEVALRTSSTQSGVAGNTVGNGELSKADPKVSARSDSVTGGTIEKGQLVPGGGELRITMNIPAFQLTLWQGGKEIKSYSMGIGREKFPLPHGNRVARQVILNPDWIPPDSEWVAEEGVEPGERIPADDPKNPLGKIKIPLGDAILIHEASSPNDIGRLVSHGCARLVRDDIFELAKMIAKGQGLSTTDEEIEKARRTKERKTLELKQPIPIEIAYDTAVVEGGKLHLYPDVYDEQTLTVEAVRKELESAKADAAKLDEQAIKKMIEKVDRNQMFVADVTKLESGKTQPIVASRKNGKESGKESKSAKSRGR